MHLKTSSPRHIIINMTKVKDKENLSSARKSYLQENYIRLSADFSTKTFQTRKDWHKIFKLMKCKNLQPILLYPVRISFKILREIKSSQTTKS